MRIVGYLMQRDELSKGNLLRCLENLSSYCDEIVVYDDGSTDGSLKAIHSFTDHVIGGIARGLANETQHRQELLELAMSLDPDWVFWLDADEVLDRPGTMGGLRELCERAHGMGWSYAMEEVTLWRSQSWRRLDYLGRGVFRRLWAVKGRRPSIPLAHGLHRQLFPDGVGQWVPAPFSILHYGYSTQEAIERRWRERTGYGVPVDIRRKGIDERGMILERVPLDLFPPGCEPPLDEPPPKPITYSYDIMREAGLL